MPYAEPKTAEELEREAIEKLREGSASLTVPFFESNSWAFDQLVSKGIARKYRVLVEIDLNPERGQGQ